MGRVILGLLKGGVVGAALGALAFKLGVGGGIAAVVLYALVGGAAGLLCGRPPWRQDTFWTSALLASSWLCDLARGALARRRREARLDEREGPLAA